MPVDHNFFFREATLLICSSLEIEVALGRCRQFIANYLPAEAISLNIYEPSLGALRYVARADARGAEKLERTIALPPELIRDIESGRRLTDHLIVNRPEQDPMGPILCEALELRDHAFIALRLRIEGHRLGVVDLFARGLDRFQPEHGRLLALLREPFAIAMANALRHQEVVQLKEQLLSDNRYLNSELISQAGDEVVGGEAGLRPVMEAVRQVAHLRNTVLLLGETGVGKEVVANAIHRLSPRRNEPFIKVNCGAIPESLIDDELFGHEKGAFTGAVSQSRGRFERANRGTIFLDEIGELPSWAQIRLLRVLQTQEIERVGGSPPIRLDIRVIAATHRDLQQMVRQGTFREDLWFRINAFPISIPPLRQRKQDIPLLVDHFIRKKALELGIHTPPRPSPAALSRLGQHGWPGNVRELENTVERALIQHRQGPLVFADDTASSPAGELALPLAPAPSIQPLDTMIKAYLEQALAATGGRINGERGAAALLGVHPNTLRNRMAKLGIAFGHRRRG